VKEMAEREGLSGKFFLSPIFPRKIRSRRVTGYFVDYSATTFVSLNSNSDDFAGAQP
jgi:hypothetical protein